MGAGNKGRAGRSGPRGKPAGGLAAGALGGVGIGGLKWAEFQAYADSSTKLSVKMVSGGAGVGTAFQVDVLSFGDDAGDFQAVDLTEAVPRLHAGVWVLIAKVAGSWMCVSPHFVLVGCEATC